jgi:predicted PurR-regulated permease PerM
MQIGTFGAIFGKAMQAQSAIAVVNTGLTALGLLVLQVSGLGFLSVLVFLCSFVPVVGVIISTVPIGLVAFTESGLLQLGLVVLMVILIHAVEAYILNPVIYSGVCTAQPFLDIFLGFHVTLYFPDDSEKLQPLVQDPIIQIIRSFTLLHSFWSYLGLKVYWFFFAAAHLKLHPLLALGVLVFAEHTLGVWGLLVAVPMAVFFIEYVIKRNPMTLGEDNNYRALPSKPS